VTPEIGFTASADFDVASDEYQALFLRCGCSPFQHPDWLSPFYGTLARAHDAEPLIVVGRRIDSGALAVVVPLVRRRIGSGIAIEYAFLGVSDYAAPVIDRAIDPAIMPARDGSLARAFLQALGRFDRLEIAPVRQDDLGSWRMLLAVEPAALGFGAHHLQRPASPRRSAELARKARRLAEHGPLTLDVVGADSIREVMAAARRFRHGRFARDPMQSEASFEFYVEAALRGQGSGLARAYRLACGNDLVAVLFGLVQGRRFHYLVLGCDYPKYGRFSPGMIMFDRAMAHWFEGGGEIFDFTIGDEAFKAGLGCARTPMYRVLHDARADTRTSPDMVECADA
jgi:CelD/BcsL family acetyltransferase involved in cellulose biosynthesis